MCVYSSSDLYLVPQTFGCKNFWCRKGFICFFLFLHKLWHHFYIELILELFFQQPKFFLLRCWLSTYVAVVGVIYFMFVHFCLYFVFICWSLLCNRIKPMIASGGKSKSLVLQHKPKSKYPSCMRARQTVHQHASVIKRTHRAMFKIVQPV